MQEWRRCGAEKQLAQGSVVSQQQTRPAWPQLRALKAPFSEDPLGTRR